jgi:MYXO-CTERM domain-containing protein
MRRVTLVFVVSILVSVLAVVAGGSRAVANQAFIKSPGPSMHFTQGVPLVVISDLFDDNNALTIVNGVGWPQYQLFVDGQQWTDDNTGMTTVPGNAPGGDGMPLMGYFYRFVASGLSVGTHMIVARGLFSSNGSTVMNVDSSPVTIVVDPWPSDKTVINLTSDMTMADLDWENVAVKGNGHVVTVSGNVVIKNSLITGLGSLLNTGMKGMVASADIEDSVFEATGEVSLNFNGSGMGVIKNNEFRANNLIRFDPSNDPDKSPVIVITGSNNTPKQFQGNRMGAGRVVFDHVSNWLIGGDTDDQSNIIMGPRGVLYLVNNITDVTVRGNYDHHFYRGGWSQGFNLNFSCLECGDAAGTRVLIEHNYMRGGSWPLQSLVGEFRYNVIVHYGHDWWRGATTGAIAHHNLFVSDGTGDLNEGVWMYTGETGVLIYNNTFDGGAKIGDFIGPDVRVEKTSRVTSFRNNLITYSIGTGPHIIGDPDTFLYADYNSFYSPDRTTKQNYMLTITGKTEGSDGFAGHDVSGTGAIGVMDGQLDASPFADTRIYPIETIIDEGAVWNKTQKVSAILAAFRAHYTPAAGAPIIDTGDPQDNDSQGRRADIGAIDATGHDQDKFGKFGSPPSETVPPTVSLTSPSAGDTVMGTITLKATAMDNPGGSGVVLVQFLVDGATVGQSAKSPYSSSFNTAIVSNATHAFAAKAWDAAGNSATSASVMVTVAGNTVPPNPGSGNGGGSGSSGSGGSGSSGTGGTSGQKSGGVIAGCGCSTGPMTGASGAIVLLGLAGLGLRRRKR